MARWEVRVLDGRRGGAPVVLDTSAPADPADPHRGVVPGPYTLSRNTWGNFSFEIGALNPRSADIPKWTREVQLWRDDGVTTSLEWWGIPVRKRWTRTTLSVQCEGLERYYGSPGRYWGPVMLNHLDPDPLDGWTAGGAGTVARVTGQRLRGPETLRVSTTAADADAYAQRTIPVTTDPALGLAFTFAGWYIIDSGAWVEVPFEQRGLYVGGASFTAQWVPLTNDRDHMDKPQRVEVTVLVPAGTTDTLDLRLYTGGVVHWGALSVTNPESVPSQVGGPGQLIDVLDIISDTNSYTQHGLTGAFGDGGKSPLNIATQGAPTGHLRDRRWYMADHANVWESWAEFTRGNLCSLNIAWAADGTSRWLQVGPAVGPVRNDLPLTLTGSAGDTLLDCFPWDEDGEQVSTSHRELGQGEGSDREIGWARDATALDDLILESVESAPPDVPVDGLSDLAAAKLARRRHGVTLPTLTTFVRGHALGDRVPTTVTYGGLSVTAKLFEIVGITTDPRSEVRTLAVNDG